MFARACKAYYQGSLILQILVGIVLGAILGALSAKGAESVAVLGDLFVGALKAVAPLLVFILVMTSICTRDFTQHGAQFKRVLLLYVIGTFLASLTAVVINPFAPVCATEFATRAKIPKGASLTMNFTMRSTAEFKSTKKPFVASAQHLNATPKPIAQAKMPR